MRNSRSCFLAAVALFATAIFSTDIAEAIPLGPRPDQPSFGRIILGNPAPVGPEDLGTLERYSDGYSFMWAFQMQCVPEESPESMMVARFYQPNIVVSGRKKFKGSQKAWVGVRFQIRDPNAAVLLSLDASPGVESCRGGWKVIDRDGDGDYDGGSDKAKFFVVCGDDLPTAFSLNSEQADLFTSTFGKKPSCKLVGVPITDILVGCFRGDTPVAAKDGPKAIRDLRIGDLVWSWDEGSKREVLRAVTRTYRAPGNGLRAIDTGTDTVYTTDEHPYRVFGKGWVTARDVAVGDVLQTRSGRVTVASNRSVDPVTFYAGYQPDPARKTARAANPLLQPVSLRSAPAFPEPDSAAAPTVYNIEVGDTHSFFAGRDRILVHNK